MERQSNRTPLLKGRAKFFVTSFLLAAALAPSVSFADFQVADPAARPSSSNNPDGRQGVPEDYLLSSNNQVNPIELIGESGQKSQPVEGFGDDIPLSAALEMLMPAGWSAYTNPVLDRDMPVSWNEGQSWTQAIEGISVRHNLRAYINFHTNIVRIEPAPKDTALARLGEIKVAIPEKVDTKKETIEKTPSKERAEGEASSAFYNEVIALNLKDEDVDVAIASAMPGGWSIELDVPKGHFGGKTIKRLTFEGARGDVLDALEQKFDVDIVAFEQQQTVVIRKQGI